MSSCDSGTHPPDGPPICTALHFLLFGIPPPSSLQSIEEDLREGQRSRYRYRLADLLTAVGVAGFVGLFTLLFWRSTATHMSWFVPLIVLAVLGLLLLLATAGFL